MQAKTLSTALFTLLAAMAVDAQAATVRVSCEASATRSKVSVDGRGLAAGSYTTQVISGGNMAAAPAQSPVRGEIETDYDSNPGDIAQGAVAIAPNFIVGGSVTGKVLDASGNTVIADTVLCRVRRR